MEEALAAALILFIIIVMPIGIVTTGILAGSIAKQWFRLQRERLALQRKQFDRNYEMQRLAADMPPWLDKNDPFEIAAWRSALQETYAIAAQRSSEPPH
jgi:hypothetical protein